MTSRIFYYFSITAFIYGIFTCTFTNNVFESFTPAILLGILGAIISLLEPDVDKTRRDAVIGLCISFCGAIALSILAPEYAIIWWGLVIIMLETVAIVSLIRRHRRKNITSNDKTLNDESSADESSAREAAASLPAKMSLLGVILIIGGAYLGGHLFVVNEWWIEVFPTSVNSGDCITDIIVGVANSVANAFVTAIAGGIIGAIIGLATYGGLIAIYLRSKVNGKE